MVCVVICNTISIIQISTHRWINNITWLIFNHLSIYYILIRLQMGTHYDFAFVLLCCVVSYNIQCILCMFVRLGLCKWLLKCDIFSFYELCKYCIGIYTLNVWPYRVLLISYLILMMWQIIYLDQLSALYILVSIKQIVCDAIHCTRTNKHIYSKRWCC